MTQIPPGTPAPPAPRSDAPAPSGSTPTPSASAVDPRRETAIGLACAVGVLCLWSGFALSSRFGLTTEMTVFDIAALRFGLSALIMLPLVLRGGLFGLRPGQALLLALCAGLGFGLFAYTGFALAPAAHGAVLLAGVLPPFTVVLAWAVLGERPGPRRLVALALIVTGVLLIARDSLVDAVAGPYQLLGNLSFLCGSCSWAIYTVFARKWQVPPLNATALVAVISGALYVPVYLVALPKGLGAVSMPMLIGQGIFHGLFVVVFALLLYTRAVKALGPAPTTLVTAAVPAVVAVLGWLLLDEALNPSSMLGIAVVVAGMITAVWSLRAGTAAPPAKARP